MKRHNPADEAASPTLSTDAAWGALYARKRNGEIDDAEFRRSRHKLLLLLVIPAAGSLVWAILTIH